MDSAVKAGYITIILVVTLFLAMVTGFDMMSFFLAVIKV